MNGSNTVLVIFSQLTVKLLFLMWNIAKQRFYQPRFLSAVYVYLRFCITYRTLLSTVKIAASALRNPMMHSDVQAHICVCIYIYLILYIF